MTTAHLLIKGKVQGVFYRAKAKEKANELQVKGWVKNNSNGDVEAKISGEDNTVKQFIEWCWRGPSRAKVSDVEVTYITYEPFQQFTINR